MSLFTSRKDDDKPSAVHSSQYIRTADKPDEAETKPADSTTPSQPEAK